MGKPYSSDLRQRFVGALDEGMSASAAGRRMRIARPRLCGGPPPGSARGGPRPCRWAGTAGLKRLRHMRRRSLAGWRTSLTCSWRDRGAPGR